MSMTEALGIIVSMKLQELAEAIGVPAALRLAEVHGGQEGCYVPRKPPTSHPWVEAIGWEAFAALCEAFGGERIDIPRNAAAQSQKSRILDLKRQGLPHRRIAAKLNCTERYVRMVVHAGDPRQASLFD